MSLAAVIVYHLLWSALAWHVGAAEVPSPTVVSIENKHIRVKFITTGATIVNLEVPSCGPKKTPVDVSLGYTDLKGAG
jgi:hypothetical protein